MEGNNDKRLRPAEVEMVLRRASELNARRWTRGSEDAPSVSPEVLVQVAAAAGIPEQDVRRAMWDMDSEKTAETSTKSEGGEKKKDSGAKKKDRSAKD